MVEPFTVAASVVVSMVLSALVAARVASRPGAPPEPEATERACCGVCGQTGTRETLRDHLKEVHKAPGAKAELDALIEPVGGSR